MKDLTLFFFIKLVLLANHMYYVREHMINHLFHLLTIHYVLLSSYTDYCILLRSILNEEYFQY
jgi:hypothetical protein